MGWSELERLVDEAERDPMVRRSLRPCRSREELVLAAWRLGYRISRLDLQLAWRIDSGQTPTGPAEILAPSLPF
jgi:hypothetical protein